MKRVLWIVAMSMVVVYAADYLVLRRSHAPFGQVIVHRFYAIPQKGNRIEFDDAGVQNVTCVHSLFRHLGHSPCWYASRHEDERIDE
jgi:hypothetical protein